MQRNLKFRIGTSGWAYDSWRDIFYPPRMPINQWLNYYSENFNTIEINSTFYKLQPSSVFSNWRTQVDNKFLFSVKAHRYLCFPAIWNSNDKKPFELFYNSIKSLENKLFCVLYLFLPNVRYDEKSFMNFLNSIDKSINIAIEVRHNSWLNNTFYKMLSDNNISLVINDKLLIEKITSNFIYMRLHSELYDENQLRMWTNKILKYNKQTFCYFDNEIKSNAIQNAKDIKEYLSL